MYLWVMKIFYICVCVCIMYIMCIYVLLVVSKFIKWVHDICNIHGLIVSLAIKIHPYGRGGGMAVSLMKLNENSNPSKEHQ